MRLAFKVCIGCLLSRMPRSGRCVPEVYELEEGRVSSVRVGIFHQFRLIAYNGGLVFESRYMHIRDGLIIL